MIVVHRAVGGEIGLDHDLNLIWGDIVRELESVQAVRGVPEQDRVVDVRPGIELPDPDPPVDDRFVSVKPVPWVGWPEVVRLDLARPARKGRQPDRRPCSPDQRAPGDVRPLRAFHHPSLPASTLTGNSCGSPRPPLMRQNDRWAGSSPPTSTSNRSCVTVTRANEPQGSLPV